MSAESDLEFLKQLQRLLEEGGFVATYKFALLQALADLSVEHESDFGGTLVISLEQIAEKFIEYYWRQAAPYRAAGNESVGSILRQNTGRQAAIVNRVAEARAQYGPSLQTLRQDERYWNRFLRQVAEIVEKMPLWKLQTVGGESRQFLYRREDYRDGRIRLLKGVSRAFRTFHGLITNLIRGGWVSHLRRIGSNQPLLGESGDLSEFLFGSERQGLQGYRRIFREYQDAVCFYCRKEVKSGGDADHFIPWSRYPVDLGHNFVFAHASCNNSKRDFLAHPEHLARWRERNLVNGLELTSRFSDCSLPHDLERSAMIAKWAYEQGENVGAHVWLRKGEIDRIDHRWRAALEPFPQVAE